nr:uncharacterized protein LOC109150167 [Ipomoea batatas]
MKLPNSNSIFLMKSDMRCLWTLRARRTTLPDTAKTAMQPALKEFSIVFCSLFLCFFQERSKDNVWFKRNVKDEVEQREKMHSEKPRNLAVYKVPSELCRKALRKRRRRLAKNGGFPVWDDSLMRMHRHTVDDAAVEPPDEDAVELEREMWNKFSGAGFWRSPSQRTDLSQL